MPPGAAKSTYTSILFPTWFLSRNPKASILAASHTVDLAEQFGRKVRNLADEYREILGYALSEDSKAAGRWATSARGAYLAAGAGKGIAGYRASLCIIDDPIRGRADADSPVVRESIWNWWISDVRPRLFPHAAVVLVQTRWHEDDLAGRILQHEGDRWEVINLPMEAEGDDLLGRKPGERLWPEWYEDDQIRDAKGNARVWSALYQQRPVPLEGGLFKADWFHEVDHLPPLSSLRRYGGSDYAVTSDGGDYTVHMVIGLDPEDNMYLLDVWRKQASSDEWVEAWCDMVLKWEPKGWAEEKGQITSGVGPWLTRRQRQRKAWCFRSQFPTRGDKAIRAQSIVGRLASCGLRILRGAPFKNDLISECVRFPGVNDDQVDALGLVGQLLDVMQKGKLEDRKKPKRVDGWDEKEQEDVTWESV